MRMSTQPIRMLVVITSLIFLNAKCTTPAPKMDDSEQCSVFLKIVNNEVIAEESVCNCRIYRFDRTLVGPVQYTEEQLVKAKEADVDNLIIIANTRYIQRKLSYCHTVTGWSNVALPKKKSWYALVAAWWDSMRLWLISNE